jgi:hypothetical protein
VAAKGTQMTYVAPWCRMVFRRRTWRSLIIVAIFGALTAGLIGCSHSLTAQSSCKDFLNASQSDQIQAIDKIAAQEDAPDATTPLGMPNISYLCAGSPNQTLGWAIAQSR